MESEYLSETGETEGRVTPIENTSGPFYWLLPELWLAVIGYLGTRDRCSLLLTCKRIHAIGSEPWLWRHTKINKWLIWKDSGLPFLRIGRFQQIRTVDLSETELSPQAAQHLFQELPQHQHLHNLSLSFVNLCDMDASVFSFITNLRSLNVQQTRLTSEQFCRLFAETGKCEKLVTLNVANNDMSQVEPQLFVQGIVGIKRVNLNSTNLSMEQSCLLFLTLAKSTPNVQHLLIRAVDLSTTNPQTLADGVAHLASISLQETHLGTSQANTIFRRLGEGWSGLKSINLSYVDLSQVYTDYLEKALKGLNRISMRWCHLTVGQISCLLQQNTSAISMDLEGNNFQGVALPLVMRYQMRRCLSNYTANNNR